MHDDLVKSCAMKCPNCLVEMHAGWQIQNVQPDVVTNTTNSTWRIRSTICPACQKLTIQLGVGANNNSSHLDGIRTVQPKGLSRPPLSPDIPAKFADDYREAVAVFDDSAKASAALSRRCLQLIIREHVGIKKADLAKEIDALLDQKSLPSHLGDAIDGVRNIGNLAAHPTKSTNTGEIVDVEPGEAEWLLDTLEGLFDFYFVQPAILQKKKDELNKKLKDLGKPPMK
jgi:hypothetical protein